MKKTTIVFVALLLSSIAFSQGEIRDFNTLFKDNITIGAKLKNNGWGLLFRKGRFINIYSRWFYEVELLKLKDPQEVKFVNPYYISLNKIYYGKLYDCWELRLSYGKLNILAWKQDAKSIEIRLFSSAGPSLLLMKPVYYYVLDKTATYAYYTKFTEDLLLQQIMEMAPYYMGINETKVNFGGHVKIGISFEHSKIENGISAAEAGVALTGYLMPVQIMYESKPKNIIANFFVSYNLGYYFIPKGKKRTQQTQ